MFFETPCIFCGKDCIVLYALFTLILLIGGMFLPSSICEVTVYRQILRVCVLIVNIGLLAVFNHKCNLISVKKTFTAEDHRIHFTSWYHSCFRNFFLNTLTYQYKGEILWISSILAPPESLFLLERHFSLFIEDYTYNLPK